MNVHQQGIGVAGIYTCEVAETKVAQVMDFARRHQHPLLGQRRQHASRRGSGAVAAHGRAAAGTVRLVAGVTRDVQTLSRLELQLPWDGDRPFIDMQTDVWDGEGWQK